VLDWGGGNAGSPRDPLLDCFFDYVTKHPGKGPPMSNGARTLLLLVSLLLGASVPHSLAGPTWLVAEDGVTEADADDDCRGDCPGDDENGECPPQCDACPCCPSATAHAGVSGDHPPSAARPPAGLRAPPASGAAKEGALSRLFRPPIAAHS